MAKKGLGTSERGEPKADVGFKKTEKGFAQHRFYLGTDKVQAGLRKARLLTLWACVEERWKRRVDEGRIAEDRPLWDGTTLLIAKEIAKGAVKVVLPKVEDDFRQPEEIAGWLREMQDDFPVVTLALEDAEAQAEGDAAWNETARRHMDAGKRILRKKSPLMLFKALDMYSEWIKAQAKSRVVGTDIMKPGAKRELNYINLTKRQPLDMNLADLGANGLDKIQDYWEGRPKSAKQELMAIDTCRDLIKTFRRFARWMHREDSIAWRLPQDHVFRKMRLERTSIEEAARANPEQIKRYKIEQISILFEYANPYQRLLLLLGLNCGFGRSEIHHLLCDYIQGDYIKGIRHKTKVYGEWCLWPITKQAIEWYLAHRRPESKLPELILSKEGLPLALPTSVGNTRQNINSTWKNLLDRIEKDHPEFPKLSFNKLRKTSGNFVRRVADGETMKVFHARGKPVKGDDHSEVYSNRHFPKVFRAIRRIGRKLQPLFDAVQEPFPAEVTKPQVSPSTIRRIKDLRKQGFKLAKIGEIVGLCEDTVRKYLKG